MNFLEQVLTVWRALLANKLRSFLTLLGVIMGVGTIVLLSSLVAGGLASIKRTVNSASGDDVLEVWVDTWAGKAEQPRRLNSGDMRSLSQASGLASTTVVPQLDDRTDVRANGMELRARVVGTNERALSFYQLEMAKGRFLTKSDREDTRHVAVIGQEVATKFFSGAETFGELKIHNQRFRVVGILSKKPSLNVGNKTWNNAVVIPDTTFMAMKGGGEIDTILVKSNTRTDHLQVTMGRLNQTVRAILEARNHPGATLKVHGADSQSGSERGFLQALQLLMVAVALLCLGVGGINIMNIMLVTVTERTREIGLRMALGASKQDIRRQFLFEATAISGFGGVLGVVGGIGLGWAISQGLNHWLGYWPYVVDPVAILVAFTSALGTGIVFGWFPARHAASLQPIECLRYE